MIFAWELWYLCCSDLNNISIVLIVLSASEIEVSKRRRLKQKFIAEVGP
jgi:hypothetical protein